MTTRGVWEAEYRNDRRAHRHRCRHCNRIVNDGERVLFVRLRNKTWVLHVPACADASIDGMTMRERFEAWAREAA